MLPVKHCLLIDDDRDDQEIFLMCLQSVDDTVDCKTIDNCVDAITMLESDTGYMPDYIFIDVNMPKMNGIECLKALKEKKHLHDTRMFMYSTTSAASTLSESKLLGAEDFIIKPARVSELRATLEAIFTRGSLSAT